VKPPRCDRVQPLASAYLDGELTAAARGVVQAHLKVCPDCLSVFERQVRFQTLVAKRAVALATSGPPADFAEAVAERVRSRRRRVLVRLEDGLGGGGRRPLRAAAAVAALMVGCGALGWIAGSKRDPGARDAGSRPTAASLSGREAAGSGPRERAVAAVPLQRVVRGLAADLASSELVPSAAPERQQDPSRTHDGGSLQPSDERLPWVAAQLELFDVERAAREAVAAIDGDPAERTAARLALELVDGVRAGQLPPSTVERTVAWAAGEAPGPVSESPPRAPLDPRSSVPDAALAVSERVASQLPAPRRTALAEALQHRAQWVFRGSFSHEVRSDGAGTTDTFGVARSVTEMLETREREGRTQAEAMLQDLLERMGVPDSRGPQPQPTPSQRLRQLVR